MDNILSKLSNARRAVLAARKCKGVPASILLEQKIGAGAGAITDSSFNEAMAEYLAKDWDTHYQGALDVLRKNEKQALYECKAFIDAQVACIEGVKSAPEVETKSEHPTKIAVDKLRAFRTSLRSIRNSEEYVSRLYKKLPNLIGMKLYFPFSPDIISRGKIKRLTPEKDYEIVGVNLSDSRPIIVDDNEIEIIVLLHRKSQHLNGLEYFYIREETEK